MICNQANSSTLQFPTRSVKKSQSRNKFLAKGKCILMSSIFHWYGHTTVWTFEQSFVDFKLLHVWTFFNVKTLQVPIVTNINFLLTFSIHRPDKKVRRIDIVVTKEMLWSLTKFSQLILQQKVWRWDWRICMWILGLKGLRWNCG